MRVIQGRWLVAAVLSVGLLVGFPLPDRPAAAGPGEIAPAAGEGGADSSGRFSTSVPIAVPVFHGLEPSLSLRYDSGTGNGFTGVGWTLTGQSFIERASPGRGAPNHNGSDIFLLDGQELVTCTALGGTHCTRQQSFQRIRRDGATDRWEVWDRDGARSTYTKVYVTARGTFRWALTEERDTHGNVVSYAYWRSGVENAYLDSISYNGTVVKLWRESRLDSVSFANGERAAGTLYRLKTIDVTTGGSRVRAYQLAYQTGPGVWGRSRLVGVRQYGRDALLDPTGTVTGGTALPAVTVGWQDGQADLEDTPSAITAVGGWDPATVRNLFGDVNGDGRADLVRTFRGGATAGSDARAQVYLSDGRGFPTVNSDAVVGGYEADTKAYLADVTGDGRADLLRVWHCGTGTCIQVLPSTGSGFPLAGGVSYAVGGWDPATMRDYFADVNGDYRADFVRNYKNGSTSGVNAYLQVRLSVPANGSYGFPSDNANSSVGGWEPDTQDHLVDVNGDARTDVVRLWDNGGQAYAQVLQSRTDQTGFSQVSNGAVGTWGGVYNYFAELNGDGKADLIRSYLDNNGTYVLVRLSSGAGFPEVNSIAPVGGWDPAQIRDYFVDVTGDGRADLLRIWPQAGSAYAQINPYNGHDFTNTSFNGPLGVWNQAWPFFVTDISGDGKADITRIYPQTSTAAYARVVRAGGPPPDLLTSLTNGIGGRLSVSYSPSTTWFRDSSDAIPAVFPTVATVTRADGRGTSFTTGYSFADPAWARQPTERRFLGYRSSTVVIDGEGTTRETFYLQTLAGAGRTERSYLKNATGQVYAQDQSSYVESATPPYTSQVSSRSRFECNLTAYCRQSTTDYTYDGFGNTLTEVDHGQIGVTGDETTTATTYQPNTNAYLVSAPATRTVYAGVGVGGAQLARSVFYYDGATATPTRGDLTRTDAWNSLTGGYITSTASYDSFGNVVTATDPRGATTTSTPDPTYHLFPIRSCNALAQCTDTDWDLVLGLPATVTDPNHAPTSTGYDPLGRTTTETDAAGKTTTYAYLSVGDPTQQRVRQTRPDGSADGLWTDTYVDGLGRTWQTVREGPTAGVTYRQDTVYRSTTTLVWKQSLWRESGQPGRYEVFTHDGADRVTQVTHPGGDFARTTYSTGSDFATTVTTLDELGHEKVTWSDVDGRIAKVREKNATAYFTTTYRHDLLGRLVRWTDDTQNTSTVAYNSLGWKTSVADMDTGASTYTHDDGGLVVSQTDAKKQTTTSEYDALGRPTVRTLAGGAQHRWFYDEPGHGAAVGRLTRVTHPAGSDSHTWDNRGQETATTLCVDAVCRTIGSGYDALGRIAVLTYPDNEQVTHTYNPAGQLTTVGGYVTSMAYNAAGQLTSMSYPNGTTATYTYDPDRQWLTSAAVTGPTGNLYAATYSYNAAGLVTSMTQGVPSPATTTYTYDDLNRLLSVSGAQSQTFGYNAIGNITVNSAVGSYAYGDPAHKHAVTSAGTASYVYDANGNTTEGDGRTLTWDTANRLTSVTRAGVSTTFAYGAGETRVKKTSGANTTRYFGNRVEDANGALVKYYYAGPILVARSSGGAKTWYHADRLGSTRLLTNSAGAEVRDYDYQAYGEIQSTTGTAANDRDYTGHTRDGETGLLYMKARYQDPKLGRFIRPDSVIPDLTNPQDINRYSYVNNNPINTTDPTGHAPWADGGSPAYWKNKAAKEQAIADQRAEEAFLDRRRKGPAPAGAYSEKACERGIRCTGAANAKTSDMARRGKDVDSVHEALLLVAQSVVDKFAAKRPDTILCAGFLQSDLCRQPTTDELRTMASAEIERFCAEHTLFCALPAPDYLSIDAGATLLRNIGVGAGGSLTITRTGRIYLAPEIAADLGPPVTRSYMAGYVHNDDGTRASSAGVSTFPSGFALGVRAGVGLTAGGTKTSGMYSKEFGETTFATMSLGLSYGIQVYDLDDLWY